MSELLTIHHQDGDLAYAVAEERETGFAVVDDELRLSVRSECTGREQWPTVFFVAARFPRAGDSLAAGQRLAASRDEDRAAVYYGERAARVDVVVEVIEVKGDVLVVDFEVTTEDVLYAGERARPSRTTGRVHLARLSADEVWWPSPDDDV